MNCTRSLYKKPKSITMPVTIAQQVALDSRLCHPPVLAGVKQKGDGFNFHNTSLTFTLDLNDYLFTTTDKRGFVTEHRCDACDLLIEC